MFIPVLLILATVWSATDGALSCPTVKGDECIFPFVTSAGKEVSECQAYKGQFYCATSVKADKKYKTWDYCIKEKCVEEKEKKAVGPCMACIVQYASQCLRYCYPNPDNKACNICLLENGTECAFICGLGDSIKDSEFGLEGVRDYVKEGEVAAGVPPCVKRGKAFLGRMIPGSPQIVNSAADCGTYCNTNFEATSAWNWYTANLKNGRFAKMCVCLEISGSNPYTRAFVDSGYGVNNNLPQCPPVKILSAAQLATIQAAAAGVAAIQPSAGASAAAAAAAALAAATGNQG